MNSRNPADSPDDDLESLAHDLLGVDLNADEDLDEPLEVEGLGLEDLGFGPEEEPAPETPAPTVDSEFIIVHRSDETVVREETARSDDDPLAWIVQASRNPPPKRPETSESFDDQDDFGTGIVEEDDADEPSGHTAAERTRPAADELDEEAEEPEVPADAGYWDALKGWDESEEKGSGKHGRSAHPPLDEERQRPSRRRRSSSRSDSRSERKPSRKAPEPVAEAPAQDEEDDFGAGLLSESPTRERKRPAPRRRDPEPEDDETLFDDQEEVDVLDVDDVEDEDDAVDEVDEEISAEADDFGAGLDESAEPSRSDRPRRRRPPRSKRARDEAPPRERQQRSRPAPAEGEQGSQEPAAPKDRYAGIPTWEQAIALLARKVPKPSGRRGGGDDRRGRGSRGRGPRGGGGGGGEGRRGGS